MLEERRHDSLGLKESYVSLCYYMCVVVLVLCAVYLNPLEDKKRRRRIYAEKCCMQVAPSLVVVFVIARAGLGAW